MIITLVNFKCYRNEKFNFNSGNLTLINGPSGEGKTTILKAIYWCLYGTLRNIYRNIDVKSKCSVLMEMEKLSIYRQGHPGLLKVVKNDKQYENDTAQSIINGYFGSKDLWKSCCYIEQNSKCDLLYCSNSERMEILNKLSFQTDDPELYIDKIDDKIKEFQIDIKSMIELYNDKVKSFEIEFEHISNMEIKEDFLDNLLEKNKIIKSNLINLKNEQLKQYKLKGKISILNDQLKVKEKEILKNNIDILENYEERLNELNNIDNHLEIEKKSFHDLNNKRFNQEKLKIKLENLINLLKKEEEDFVDLKVEFNNIDDIEKNLKIINEKLEKEKEKLSILENRSSKQKESIIKLKLLKDNLFEKEIKLKDNEIKYSSIEEINKKIEIFEKNTVKYIENEDLKKINYTLLENNKNYDDKHKSYKLWKQIKSVNISEREIEEIKENEKKYNLNNKLSLELNINYDRKILNDEIQKLLEQITLIFGVNTQEKILERVNLLKTEIDKINFSNDISQEDINTLKVKYNEIEKGFNILKCPNCNQSLKYNLGKLYKEEDIKVSTKQELDEIYSNIISLKEILDNNRKYDSLNEKLSELNNVIETKNLKKVNVNIRDILKRINDLSKIQFIKKSRISYEIAIDLYNYKINTKKINDLPKILDIIKPEEKELENLKQSYNLIKKKKDIYNILSKDIEILKLNINKISINTLLDEELSNSKKLYENYHEKFLNLEKELIFLKKKHRINTIRENISDIHISPNVEENYKLVEEKIKTLTGRKKILQEKYEKYKKYCNVKVKIEDLKNQIKNINIIEDIDDQCEKESSKLEENINLYNKCKKCIEKNKRKKELEKFKEKIEKSSKDVIALGNLKEKSLDLECRQLQETVDSINIVVNSIIEKIFDFPINFNLKLYKEYKKGNNIKPKVNFHIEYKGSEYDNVSNMSGGEADRISIALILAINRIISSPFLLLDESMSSLDEEIRIKCINEIKSFTNNSKIVICISHEDMEGNYDNVLNI